MYKKTNFEMYRDKAKNLQKSVKRSTQRKQKQFICSTESDIKLKPNNFWSYMTNKRKTSSIPGKMFQNDISYTTAQEIVDGFADHFKSVFVKPFNSSRQTSDNSCDIFIHLMIT